jgi:hypothetical protein
LKLNGEYIIVIESKWQKILSLKMSGKHDIVIENEK